MSKGRVIGENRRSRQKARRTRPTHRLVRPGGAVEYVFEGEGAEKLPRGFWRTKEGRRVIGDAPSPPSMMERIEALEARVTKLEGD